jgi:hypothetical protein
MNSTTDNTGIRGQRVRKGKGHEPIRREALQDPRLSFKATGILSFLLSLPDNWRTDAARLSKAKNSRGKVKEGRESIQNGLQELEDTGYLVRRKYQNEHGRWTWDWRYGDDPADLVEQVVSAGQTGNGLPGDGSTVDGSTGDGSPVDIEVLDVEVLEVDKNLKKRTLKPSADAAATTGGATTAPVQAGVANPEPQVPRHPAPASVETQHSADDHGGELVLLEGVAPAAPKKTRKRKTDDPDRERNAGDVVTAWVDAYRTTGNEPLGRRCGQVGKEAKELLAAGYTVDRLIEVAKQAGKQGWFSLERQLTAAARVAGYQRPNRIRDFKSPTDQSVYDHAL